MSADRSRPVTLDQFVGIAERFHRSVNLVQDWKKRAGLEDYLITPTAHRLGARMLQELETGVGTRAWSLVGPYGAGKSAFALFLTELLCSESSHLDAVAEIRQEVEFHLPAFVPVLLVADRSPLERRIVLSIADAFRDINQAIVDEAGALAEEHDIAGANLNALLKAAAQAAVDEGRGGILLVVDEFGKFLEYAAAKPDERDILFLQTLAEAVARTEHPVLFLTVLHQGFADYLSRRDELHRREWQKVQGRFREVAFQLPVEQLLTLVGTAIETDLPNDLEAAWLERIASVGTSAALEPVTRRLPLEAVLPDTVPLDPITVLLLWPLFRSKMAQNERSLFAFLTSLEPFGFREYLETTVCDGGQAPSLYDVARLYDYVDHALALGAFRGEQGRRWAEIQRCLGRLPADASEITERLVKAIGLLSIYGPPIGLAASEEVLRHAVPAEPEQLESALQLLRKHSIAVFRKHRNAYGLWEGSDVDLEEAHEEARREIGGAGLAQRLEKHLDLQPVVARAHYIESGTLRYFDTHVVDADPAAVEKAFQKSRSRADGNVVFVVGLAPEQRLSFMDCIKKRTQGEGRDVLNLVAIPDDVVRLDDALQELEAWRWIRENISELQGDEAARREVKSRISHARDVIGEKAGQVFGLAGYSFRPELSEWIQGGEVQPRRSIREFQRWISELCSTVFYKAPKLHNELLNRQSLSSASTAARRTLIESMMERANEEGLGIAGTPAEASMYESVLKAGGFHRDDGSRWRFSEPGEEWAEVWAFLEDYFSSTARQRRVVTDVFSALQEPPFGLRDGPIPVLFVAFVILHREEVAFYEDGVYVPDVSIEVVERLLARPESFEIQTYALEAEQKKVLSALADKVVSPGTAERPEAELLPIVRSLVRQAAELKPYTRNTRSLEPPEALDVRDALLEATSPLDLLFKELPAALGLELDSSDCVEDFADGLRGCMLAIHRAYPALLDEIETALRNAFDLPDVPAVTAVASLRKRAKPLVAYALEDTLQVFVREAARLNNQRDWREVLGRVVEGGMPPSHWSDKDLATFQVKLRKLSGSFRRLEELVAEQGGKATGPIFRLGILREHFDERRAVVSVDDDIKREVSRLASDLKELLANDVGGNGNGRRIRIAALAQVSESLLDVVSEGGV